METEVEWWSWVGVNTTWMNPENLVGGTVRGWRERERERERARRAR